MSSITVSHDGRMSHDGRKTDEPFANYLYAIFRDGERIAEMTHTYRGDELSMRLIGGKWIEANEVIITGGGLGVQLTPAGAQMLEALLKV